jgi:hypothetical protein
MFAEFQMSPDMSQGEWLLVTLTNRQAGHNTTTRGFPRTHDAGGRAYHQVFGNRAAGLVSNDRSSDPQNSNRVEKVDSIWIDQLRTRLDSVAATREGLSHSGVALK